MAESSTKSGMERFIERCRQEGLKVTPQRIAIYKVLMESRDHPSTDAVYRKMSTTHPTISFDTVNRTLLTFADIGVIETVESYSVSRRFDTVTSPHHHLHCIKCGNITDFTDPSLEKVKVPESINRQFEVIGKRMVVSCICPDCAETVTEERVTV